MKLLYGREYSDVKLNDLESVQKTLEKSGVIIDVNLLPLIQEAEAGDQIAMKELWEMFVNGFNNVTPNFVMAERYWLQLFQAAKESGNPELIDQALRAQSYMFRIFWQGSSEADQVTKAALSYMIENLPFIKWDVDFIKEIQEDVDYRQEFLANETDT